MTLPELLAALTTQRETLRRKITPEAVHAFARTVNAVGYHDVRVLAREHIALDELVAQVHHYYEVVLKRDPKDDFLMHKPEARWHDYPDALTPGAHTLVAYFDPHGM